MATEKLINHSCPNFFSNLHFLLFGGTLFIYNITGLYNIKNRKFLYNKSKWIAFSLGTILILIAIPHLNASILFLNLILCIISLSYSIPLLPFPKRKRLREIGWLKPIILSGVWTWATSFLPILFCHKNILQYPFEIIMRFTFLIVICILFDVRDLRQDFKEKISTIPVKVGLQGSYRLMHFFLLLYTAANVLQFYHYNDKARLFVGVTTAITTLFVIKFLRTHPNKTSFAGLGDGVMLLYSAMILW